ncbi:OmpH family outer membrane protein [Alphaproteobacteria bacterium]|nr:OmpH family outer membrane protein [Alphaproteobacteria bacterium]
MEKTMIMKKIALFVLPVAMMAGVAQASEQVVTGVVNVEKVFADAKARKALVKKVDALREKLQKDVTKKEDSLRAVHEKLSKQQETLSKDAFEKKKAEIEERVMKFRQDVNHYQEEIRTTYEVGMQKNPR